jgi:hypothetical protein
MRRDGGDARAPAVDYRICREIFLLAPGTFRCGTMLVNFTALKMFRMARQISLSSGHGMQCAKKIRALVDNIRGKKDRDIEGEVVKKDDDDG